MATIAIVEDQATIAQSIAYALRRAGHETALYEDGQRALDALIDVAPDLAVIDWMLPGLDGLELTRRLRARWPHLMILILTARNEEIDRVVGLESGADDYLTKPFSLRELEARIKNLLRRAPPPEAPADLLELGRFRLDRRACVFQLDGRVVALAPREMDLLAMLMERKGEVVSRDELFGRVWGPDFMGEAKTLDVHVRRLREKIEEDPARPVHVVTVRSRGFRFDP
jgi:DNA-binding response OmpR family regulator